MGNFMVVEERSVDSHGRISLPSDWRKKYLEQDEVIIISREDELVIRPKKARPLSDFFDSVDVDLKTDLSDWYEVKKELLGEE
jgi:bifunctional DNA-binding transcriptional regulator/antitoxin component of YhaV-PrlF toxin-antitoxin module